MNNSLFIEKSTSDFSNYYWFENAFDEKTIQTILNQVNLIKSQKGVTGDNQTSDSLIRSSTIKWIPQTLEWIPLYEQCLELVMEANKSMWNLDISNVLDSIQYTEYYASDQGHYDWHMDVGSGRMSHRKLSLVVQISDPVEYDGGDLELWFGGKDYRSIPKALGNAVIFPSFYMHRVTPVTRGIRKSLVLWVGGTPYR
jgi:PKHD-type hydroxylase